MTDEQAERLIRAVEGVGMGLSEIFGAVADINSQLGDLRRDMERSGMTKPEPKRVRRSPA